MGDNTKLEEYNVGNVVTINYEWKPFPERELDYERQEYGVAMYDAEFFEVYCIHISGDGLWIIEVRQNTTIAFIAGRIMDKENNIWGIHGPTPPTLIYDDKILTG